MMSKITVPNPFFISRNTQPHVGDRVEFAVSPNRSLSIEEAKQLCAYLAFLVDDDKGVGELVEALRDHPHAAKHLGAPAR